MTIQQLSQVMAALPVEQLTPILYEAEKSLAAVNPHIEYKTNLMQHKQNLENELISAQDDRKEAIVAAIVCVVAAAVCFILSMSMSSSNILGIFVLFFGIGAVGSLVVYLIKFFSAIGKISRLQNELNALAQTIASADQQRDQVVVQYTMGLQNLMAIGNNDLWSPAHLRTFISYFETSRARSLNEARSLFEAYMHRVRMEQSAGMQLNASIAARNAAFAAAQASRTAATAAQNAQGSANQAAFNSRFYNN